MFLKGADIFIIPSAAFPYRWTKWPSGLRIPVVKIKTKKKSKVHVSLLKYIEFILKGCYLLLTCVYLLNLKV